MRTATQKNYFVEDYGYLTPFASPCVSTSCVPGSSHFGTPFGDFPPLIPLAVLTLPFLLLFRLTCYYYRKAYYRAFWLSPPACAVAEPHKSYSGETRFPLIVQNVHRYFFYAAVIVSLINTYDFFQAFRGADGGFGIGLGTLVIGANVVLLWCYTLAATAAATSSAAGSTTSAGTLSATACGAGSRSSTSGTCSSPGSPWAASSSPTPTSPW